jgi:hypothetical protein
MNTFSELIPLAQSLAYLRITGFLVQGSLPGRST